MRDEIERFVATLAIPDDRKAVVLAELADHVACAAEAAAREGRDPEEAARAALGNLEALRRSLEAVEPAFRVTRWHALARGTLAGLLVAAVIDQLGATMGELLGSLVAIAIVLVLAPPRIFELLRAELRACRIRGTVLGGVPIGAATTYLFTVMSVPILTWMSIIVYRAVFLGITYVDVPLSALAVITTAWALLLFEGVRARLHAAA